MKIRSYRLAKVSLVVRVLIEFPIIFHIGRNFRKVGIVAKAESVVRHGLIVLGQHAVLLRRSDSLLFILGVWAWLEIFGEMAAACRRHAERTR